MSGAHRGTGDTSLAAAAFKTGNGLKTLGALAAIAAIAMTLLAVLALPSYILATRPADLSTLTIAAQSLAWITLAVSLAASLVRGRTRSPQELVERLARAGLLLCWTIALLSSIGEQRGWNHGIFEGLVVGISSLAVLGIPAYSFGGKRRLTAALTARAAARQGPP
jgi:hypothetical protein